MTVVWRWCLAYFPALSSGLIVGTILVDITVGHWWFGSVVGKSLQAFNSLLAMIALVLHIAAVCFLRRSPIVVRWAWLAVTAALGALATALFVTRLSH